MQIEQYAQVMDPAIERELRRAEQLAGHGFYTEAGLRLGRAVEAALYGVAIEFGLDLTNRVIDELKGLQDMLRQSQANLLRDPSSDNVRGLSNISKRVAECIARLAEEPAKRQGTLEESPRPNEQLYRELISLIEDKPSRRRLREVEERLRTIQGARNFAAHAALDGAERELDQQSYEDLSSEVEQFLSRLFDFRLGHQSEGVWSVAAD